jgi:hypothetical protein
MLVARLILSYKGGHTVPAAIAIEQCKIQQNAFSRSCLSALLRASLMPLLNRRRKNNRRDGAFPPLQGAPGKLAAGSRHAAREGESSFPFCLVPSIHVFVSLLERCSRSERQGPIKECYQSGHETTRSSCGVFKPAHCRTSGGFRMRDSMLELPKVECLETGCPAFQR